MSKIISLQYQSPVCRYCFSITVPQDFSSAQILTIKDFLIAASLIQGALPVSVSVLSGTDPWSLPASLSMTWQTRPMVYGYSSVSGEVPLTLTFSQGTVLHVGSFTAFSGSVYYQQAPYGTMSVHLDHPGCNQILLLPPTSNTPAVVTVPSPEVPVNPSLVNVVASQLANAGPKVAVDLMGTEVNQNKNPWVSAIVKAVDKNFVREKVAFTFSPKVLRVEVSGSPMIRFALDSFEPAISSTLSNASFNTFASLLDYVNQYPNQASARLYDIDASPDFDDTILYDNTPESFHVQLRALDGPHPGLWIEATNQFALRLYFDEPLDADVVFIQRRKNSYGLSLFGASVTPEQPPLTDIDFHALYLQRLQLSVQIDSIQQPRQFFIGQDILCSWIEAKLQHGKECDIDIRVVSCDGSLLCPIEQLTQKDTVFIPYFPCDPCGRTLMHYKAWVRQLLAPAMVQYKRMGGCCGE